MARTKTINIEGEQFVIAPLSIDQVDEYLGSTPGENAPPTAWRDITLKVIVNSLNNAAGEGEPKLTLADVKKRLDLMTMNGLHREILDMSGLRAADRGAAVGESQAVLKTETVS